MAEPKIHAFRPPKISFAIFVLGALALIPLSLRAAVAGLQVIAARGDGRMAPDYAALDAAGAAMAQADLWRIAVSVVLTVALGFWVVRATLNVATLPGQPLRYSPVGAIAALFLPVVNLVLPYFMFRDLWRRSTPRRGVAPEAPLDEDPGARLLLWWLLWAIAEGSVLVSLGWDMWLPPLQAEEIVYRLPNLVSDLAEAPSVLATLLVVWAIQRRQVAYTSARGAEAVA